MMLKTLISLATKRTSFARSTRALLSIVVVLNLTTGISAQTAPATKTQELKALHAVLESDAARLQKIEACKRIAAIGTGESIPVLAKLLIDPTLSHAARIGLEAISGPAAGEALRTAIPKVEGEQLVGIVNSLGARRDVAAVPLLRELLKSPAADVGCAAAFALGRIANEEAVAVLSAAISSTAPAVQTAIGQGCLIAVDQCRRDGRLDAANTLCERVMQAQLPPHIRLSAIRGALLSKEPIDTDHLNKLIRSENRTDFAMALIAVREFPGDTMVSVVDNQLDQLSPDRQVLLILALGDRGDEAALPVVLTAAQSPDESVRAAATRCLANFQHDSVCPRLLGMACEADQSRSKAACEALVLMTNPSVDTAILERMKDADQATRIVLYELIGRRHIATGVPVLLQGADAQEITERVAAIGALGKTIPATQLNVLTQRLVAKSSSEETEAVRAALTASCVRLGDAETCAREIVTCLPKTSGAVHLQLYDLLGLIGGPTALDAVAKAAKDPTPAMQDTVTRVLGQWMSPDAAPLLLEIAQSQTPENYRIRALRGYIRILRQFDMTSQKRIDMCNNAMPLAERKEERLLMLEALLRVPARETLLLAVTQLDSVDVSHRACEVSLLLSNVLAAQHPDTVINAMRKVLATTEDATFKGYAQQLITRAEQAKK